MSFPDGSPSKSNDYFLRLEIDGEEGGEFIDHWDTGELLFLASSVQRSDRNWVSVARGLKLYGEQTRPSDFYTPKNCALQYTKLLSEVDEDSKKKTIPRTERETSEAMLVKNLTDKRLSELAWLNQQTKSAANVLKTYVDMVENGELDDQLDDLLKNIEEKEKREEEKYIEYLSKRESLNVTKKLNKSRLAKGKASKALDSKKKNSPFSDIGGDSPTKTSVADVVKSIKKEIEEEELAASTKHVKIKSELDTNISLNALLDSKITMPASVSPTSPLLTSLLRTITSSSSSASPQLPPLSSSPMKESDLTESDFSKSELEMAGFPKSKEVSPRGSVPQSPRPTPSSSPLLNSLLKNSPSSTTPTKEISPKTVSSPQPFFNPSSALASAAAQQLAVATSSQSLSHQFFPNEASDSRKLFISSSPTSACLSAPTLSKLLEMPPSTPGRLPPLPILDPPLTSTVALSSSPVKSSQHVKSEMKLKLLNFSPSKKISEKGSLPSPLVSDLKVTPLTSCVSTKLETESRLDDKKMVFSSDKLIDDIKIEPDDDLPDVTLLEEICDGFHADIETVGITETNIEKSIQEPPSLSSIVIKQEPSEKKDITCITGCSNNEIFKEIKTEKIENFPMESNLNIPEDSSESNRSLIVTVKNSEEFEEKETSRKIFKSRTPKKLPITEEDSKSNNSAAFPLLTPFQIKKEPESPSKKLLVEFESPLPKDVPSPESEENFEDKPSLSQSEKKLDVKPVVAKPKVHETISSDKADISEDEMPSSIRRSCRKSVKKSRGRGAKLSSLKPIEPKDQYEFSESAEENSVGYLASNSLCYGPRTKESSRFEDKTKLLSQSSEDSPQTSTSDSLFGEKKVSPMKTSSEGLLSSRDKSPFGVDEDAISDSFTSDDASNSVLTEDKLKIWDESTEKKADSKKQVSENSKASQNASKIGENIKKKPPLKRNLSNKSNPPSKKERKLTSSDIEELSAGSRDSEDVSCAWKQNKEIAEQKDPKNIADTKTQGVDRQMSSSIVAESEQMDDIESLQGSITTEFSPLQVGEIKDEKEAPTFGKQDWFQGVSPKSSEHVSQSSEESEEYESDNWDNQSVSTNKSASHLSDHQPRIKRKERESAQHKAWKKAIHIVLREASCHKYANVFLQKVTNDVAPGYSSIVYRPMDLSLIKKNIDNGTITTTEEFHRDMLLMFQNAIMYNSSDHDVYKMAVEMQRDVIQQIKAFLTTQHDKDEHSEPTSSLRAARTVKSQKGIGKQSTSLSHTKAKEEERE